MSDIESYSKYLNNLVKEEKYENVIIDFKASQSKFSDDDIRGNQYLLQSLLKSYKKTSGFSNGIKFIERFVQIEEIVLNKYTLSDFGWFIHDALKNVNEINQDELVILENKVLKLFENIDPLNNYHSMLFLRLIQQFIRLEENKDNIALDRLFSVFKTINLRKDKDIQELFKADDYVIPGILKLIRKSGKVDSAFQFLELLRIEVNKETKEALKNAYGWTVYTKYKQENNSANEDAPEESFDSLLYSFEDEEIHVRTETDRNELNSLVLETLPILDTKSKYSPFSKLFRLVIKAEKDRNNTSWQFLFDLLNGMKPEELSTENEIVEFVKNGKPKQSELASDLENWCATYSGALLKLGRFEDCLKISNWALESFEKFHYSNDIWFARKIALCHKNLGDIDSAISDMELIESKKGDWFIQKELAELYVEKEEFEKAMNMSCKAALNFGDVEKKDGLFNLIGTLLKNGNEIELAYKHFLLVKEIRESEGWGIPPKLKENLTETKPVDEIENYEGYRPIYNELNKYWKTKASSNNKERGLRGRITKIQKGKGFGFIRSTEKEDFYFNEKKSHKTFHKLEKDMKVKFECIPNPNPEKNRIAIKIEIDKS